MSFTDSDPEWKNTKIKTEHNITRVHISSHSGKQKYSQKFCDKWLTIFNPWLQKCEDDLNKPFCIACQCRLDCNRCHLQRHERTTKHARNLEILISKGEGATTRQSLSIRQERSKYYQQRKHLNSTQEDLTEMDTTDDFIEVSGSASFQFEKTENTTDKEEAILKQESSSSLLDPPHRPNKTSIKTNLSNRFTKKPAMRKERMKLLLEIQKDKNELMDSFKELMDNRSSMSAKEKNHVDLFFDSVSSTVKGLSPKLIAEAKMRVSQLICELELRALNEGETSVSLSEPVVSLAETNNTYMIKQQRHCQDKDGEHYN